MATKPVHDRDGVHEDVERPRTRPQGQDEAQRDDVDASTAQYLVQRGCDELVHGGGGQRLGRQVEHAILEHLDLGDVVLRCEVADGAREAEDQRRQRQDREEGRLGGEPGDPVLEAGRRRSCRQAPRQRGHGVAKPVQHHGDYGNHMRTLTTAAILGAASTWCSAVALRAPDAAVAVAAVALVTAFATWVASLHTTDEVSGLALASPASAITLTVVRRFSAGALLPLIAAQVVGAVAGGFAALGLDGHLRGTLAWTDASAIATGVVVGVLGIIAAWVTLAVDGGEHVSWSGLPPVLSGAMLGVGLAAALNPATVIGLATAGVINWLTAGIAAVTGLVAAAIGGYAINAVTPAD